MAAFEILVAILSVFLALFLLASIVLVVLLIRVTKQIKNVTNSAERTVNGVERFVLSLNKASAPLMLVRLVRKNFSKSQK